MRLSKRQLKQIIREEKQKIIKESRMKNFLGELENEILDIAREEFGGEITVQDVVEYMAGYANDPMGNPQANYAGAMSYEEALDIMWGMVDGGLLTDGYEDFFSVHPDYM